MVLKLHKEELEAERAALMQLLKDTDDSDPVGRISFQARIDHLAEEIAALDTDPDTTAEVALVFNDGPVYGTRAIDAEFAGKALEAYQELISKRSAISTVGGLAQRGPVPGRDSSRLLVTDIVRGSFGFLLREARADQPGFVPSSLRESVGDVTTLLQSLTEQTDEQFLQALEEIDARVFVSLRKFVETLHDYSASMRLVDGMRELKLDQAAVLKAHERVTQTALEQIEYNRKIHMLGIIPVGRRFEAVDIETQEFIGGKVGPAFSQGYLERVNFGQVEVSGKNWLGTFRRKTARRTDGRETVTITLLDLQELQN